MVAVVATIALAGCYVKVAPAGSSAPKSWKSQ
jgi:hypothetical protein